MNNLRAIATVAVILLHVSTIPVVSEYEIIKEDNSNLINGHIGNMFDSLVRFCVPVFVMLTGALLLPQRNELSPFLKKRVKRVILPFVFWSCIYTIFNIVLKLKKEEKLTLSNVLKLFITDFLQGPYFHFWYIYMIICLYLFIPIIGPWINQASKQELIFFLTIWTFTLILNQEDIRIFNVNFDFKYFSGYLGYLVLGYFIAHRVPISRKIVFFAIVMFLVGYIITSVGTYLSSLDKGSFSHKWYEYLTLNVALMSTGIFILIKAWKPNNTIIYLPKLRDLISKYSYGIYFVHTLILGLLSYAGVNYLFINPVLGILLTTFICLCISLLIIYVINKLPLGKYISG